MNLEPVHVESEPSSDSGNGPFSGPSTKLNRLIDGIRSLEQWYASDFERRIASLTDLLKREITEELRAQFSAELDSRGERIREQYEERLYAQARQWQSQRESLEKEIEGLQRRVPTTDVLREIADTEAALSRCEINGNTELGGQVKDVASICQLLQSHVEELAMKAYLKGLKFQTKRAE